MNRVNLAGHRVLEWAGIGLTGTRGNLDHANVIVHRHRSQHLLLPWGDIANEGDGQGRAVGSIAANQGRLGR